MTLLITLLLAQETIAPTREPIGKPRGENVGGYNVLNSFETGARFFTTDGNEGKYRSDVNFRNGIRVLGSSLTINSREGRGRLFDEILLNTQGLGNDPYQSAILRVQKNKLYRFDLNWRLNDYFNPALTIAGGNHFINTTRRLQDHTLTLLPQSSFQFFAGYTSNYQAGPALSTIQLFDSRGNEFPYFSDIRRRQTEFRVGGQAGFAGMKLFWQRGWEWFKDDPRDFAANPTGLNPNSATTLQSFNRAEPWRGEAPHWRVNLITDAKRWYGVSARFSHVDGQRNFILDERATGAQRLGGALLNRQFLLFGNGRRPVTAANLTLSVFPTEQVTIANHTAFHHTRMEGDATYREFNNATLGIENLNFQFLGIRAFTNTTDVSYRPLRWLGVTAGYQFTSRRVRSIEQLSGVGFVERDPARGAYEQDNNLHTGLLGFRLQPAKGLTINLDGELTRADRPFFPTSERNYHALGARVLYKRKNFQLNAHARSRYNFNGVSLWSHSSRGRTYAFNGSWTPRDFFSLDAGYSKIHLDTYTGLAYFANLEEVTSIPSIYISNLHTVHLTGRVSIRKKVDLYAGYSRNQDTGDGHSSLGSGAFERAQTFPVLFHSPMFRISVPVRQRFRVNFGYQYYGYDEKFGNLFALAQDYRAHTGYASLLWSF
jgi:hypothetical protein